MTVFKGIFDNYRIKLLLSIVLINLFMVPVLVWNRIELIHKDIYERENRVVISVSRLLQNAMQDDLEDGDTLHLREYLSIARHQAMVADVLVTDLGGKVVFSDDSLWLGQHVMLRDDGDINNVRTVTYSRVLPIQVRGVPYGFLRIDFSLAGVRREMREAFIWSFGLNGLWIILVCIAAFFASGKLFEPLAEMKVVSQRIAKGDFTARSAVVSHDSLGELAAALNRMAAQLSGLTSGMQEKIEYATAGLRISNETLQQKMEELEESNRKLMQLDVLKSEFVSMVSHDLKTPLTSIIGFSRTLMSLDLNPNQRVKYLGIIENEGKRLARLISEYLDISKIEAGKFNLNVGKVQVPALIDEIVQTFGQQKRGWTPQMPHANYMAYRGGVLRFGKLTMTDTDMRLIDADPTDPFDFFPDHYNEHLVAGYSKTTASGGLLVYMPDYNKIGKPLSPR